MQWMQTKLWLNSAWWHLACHKQGLCHGWEGSAAALSTLRLGITEFTHFFHRLIETKSEKLKLLRFEIWFWFRPQVKNKGEGGWVFEISSFKGTQLIRFITSHTSPPSNFTWRREQNPLSKRSNFNHLDFVFIRRCKTSINSIFLNTSHCQNLLASTEARVRSQNGPCVILWTKCDCERVFFFPWRVRRVSSVGVITPMLRIHAFNCYQRCVTSTFESVVDCHTENKTRCNKVAPNLLSDDNGTFWNYILVVYTRSVNVCAFLCIQK